jgi:hypothetical protein
VQLRPRGLPLDEVCLSQSHRSGSGLRLIGGGSGGWLWLSVIDGK